MRQHGLLRSLKAAELSDGTLRYFLLISALLSPRPPTLMILNEPETSLHQDLLAPLARLVAGAASRSQIFVVTHARPLAESLLAEADCRLFVLGKELGETVIADVERPTWTWQTRMCRFPPPVLHGRASLACVPMDDPGCCRRGDRTDRSRRTADIFAVHQIEDLAVGMKAMAKRTSKISAKVARKAAAKRVAAKAAKARKTAPKAASKPQPHRAAKPALLAGGNPQIAKADGDAPVQAYIAAMPGWKRDVGRRLDALIARTVPGVRKAVKWNSPLYGVEGRGKAKQGPRMVPRRPLPHEVREGGFLPRRVAASCPSRRVQEQGHALPRHPRGRAA